jgi:nucleoside-diphosphate-sugar epimerase
MKVGITGGAGFIGSWVTDELIARGHTPIIFDTRGRKPREDVEVMLGDIRDEVSTTELAAHVDGIIHLAAVLGTQETIKNPRPAFLTNGIGGLNVLEAVTQYDLPLVNICVGNYWMNNSYSITKSTFERTLSMFIKENGTRAANVRCVNAYGPRQAAAPPFAPGKVRKIMPSFICRALTEQPIEIYGDGEQISDMVYVGDVAKALVGSLEFVANGGKLERTLECGPLTSATVNDVAWKVAEAAWQYTGKHSEIVHLPMRPGENAGDTVTCDGSTLADIGMNPELLVSLTDGIRETVAWFDQNKGITWIG